jgi:Sulfotransferase domain
LQLESEIIIVSGLPRSGTSLMMQMLENGGIEVLTDQLRSADVDNPRGYYELEKVKKIKEDASWLPLARGKAFKMVSQLLYCLPPTEEYRIIFMNRDLDEVLRSQEKMLKRLGRSADTSDEMKQSFAMHLQKLQAWLQKQENMQVLRVSYNDLMGNPKGQAERVNEFLRGGANVPGMAKTVDPSLYRNRKALD